MAQNLYTVIRDTREKQGWIFDKSSTCEGTIVKTMKTGDYTLVGYEHLLTVERKKNVAEFAGNVVQARFEKELERMQSFKYAFVICEFTYDHLYSWPLNSGLPKWQMKNVKISKHFIVKKLIEFELKYNAKFILAGHHAKDVTASLFKRVIENEKEQCEIRQ